MRKAQQVAFLFYMLLLEGARQYLFSKCTERNEQGCWLWTGVNDGRYGHAWYLGERFKAHRLAYLAFRGPIYAGKVLDHVECDCTQCFNPWHVEPVSQRQNMMRCFDSGRGVPYAAVTS